MTRITVTQPLLPPLEEFIPYLQRIWDTRILTNGGQLHQELEAALCAHLGVSHLSLFTNATTALMAAVQVLGLKGEVITTPFSFVAGAHALRRANVQPVFVDVEPRTLNIDPSLIEGAITPRTTAIMAVHCYGNPCAVDAIQAIAERHGLQVLYDAAHAFGVCIDGRSILHAGDLSVLSFHATKVFNTFEGGAIIAPDAATKARIDQLKNFGMKDEATVDEVGLNGKMSEVHAAFGLLQLRYVDEAIEKRATIARHYRQALSRVRGIECLPDGHQDIPNHSYFPVRVRPDYPLSRDGLYEMLRARDIYARRYFYPLITDFPAYQTLPRGNAATLPVAVHAAREVLCLPIHPALTHDDLVRVIDAITHPPHGSQ
ncbi:DegT/DnrJ/EryC1/StrS family aminotransferase [Gemmatimonas sp.]|uniref:DegT/DnrJ/EryC1/StrS family aminotransferase n=1 Tax=Gemmatimonas sp. TaxID=1962908 RepID=UPI003F6F44ED